MSKKNYLVGIDIGGTNTDAVLVDNQSNIIASCKIPTENPLENGVKKAIQTLIESSNISRDDLKGIYLGTTHATNAILEAKELYKVGVLRLAGQRPITLDPCFKWPELLKSAVYVGLETVAGGFRCDQKEISPVCKDEIKMALEKLHIQGMESLSIIGVFSPLSAAQELTAKALAKDMFGYDFPVTISSEIGGMGFVERENASILNAALKKPMSLAFQNMNTMINELLIEAPLFVTQNDGSIIDLEQAIEKPLLTISSGPTNSFIGGVKLAGVSEAIIVDIGGTSVDIGVVQNGYPRRSLGQAMIGGIPLNFKMPDVLSLPIGGGSIVRRNQSGFTFGPDSIGSRLFTEGSIFGGSMLTLTDVACKASLFSIPTQELSKVKLNEKEAKDILYSVLKRIQEAIRLMQGSRKNLPIIAVGGGAYFLKEIADAIPEKSNIANAYGASMAEVSYTVDTVVSLENRDKALASITEEAMKGAKTKGACESTLRIVDIQVLPYHYVPNKIGRVVATASGKQSSL